MCGLFGFVGNHPKRAEVLKILCVLNADRGEDSTGIASFNQKNGNARSVKMFKKVVEPYKFVRLQGFHSIVNDESAACFIGHTRWATHGAVSKKNAHPFRIGDTVGAHNGVVSNLWELRKEIPNPHYDVDSQYLIHLIEKTDHVSPAEGKLNLAYCKLRRKPTLTLWKMGNPLYYIMGEKNDWLAYSSEYKHLEMVEAILNLEGTIYKLDDGDRMNFYYSGGVIAAGLIQEKYKFESLYSGAWSGKSYYAGGSTKSYYGSDSTKSHYGSYGKDVSDDSFHQNHQGGRLESGSYVKGANGKWYKEYKYHDTEEAYLEDEIEINKMSLQEITLKELEDKHGYSIEGEGTKNSLFDTEDYNKLKHLT